MPPSLSARPDANDCMIIIRLDECHQSADAVDKSGFPNATGTRHNLRAKK
jgi:hypothetical protein